MVTRYLADREEGAGARGLHRTTRRLGLTAAGAVTLAASRPFSSCQNPRQQHLARETTPANRAPYLLTRLTGLSINVSTLALHTM